MSKINWQRSCSLDCKKLCFACQQKKKQRNVVKMRTDDDQEV